MITKQQAALAAILYADVFDYPLTESDLLTWSVERKEVAFPKEATKHGAYVVLAGREKITGLRVHRAQHARKKWEIASQVAHVLRFVPTIQLVGVTGGLSMNNAREDDDIDFFFIVAPGSLWISRFFAVATIELLGKRRRRGETNIKNTICLNMFMSQSQLSVPKKEHDLYVAHEVLQMTPLWERGMVYKKFLHANQWVKTFLPNAWKEKTRYTIKDLRFTKRKSVASELLINILRFFEPIAKYIQLQYMKSHRTTEIIDDGVLRFHPLDARVWVKQKLSTRFSHYNIPLDKVFYGR